MATKRQKVDTTNTKMFHKPKSQVASSSNFFIRPSQNNDNNERKTLKEKNKPIREQTVGEMPEKKPFDKNKWRMQKYSRKYKLECWEEKRRKVMMHRYKKELKREDKNKKFDVKKIYEEEEERLRNNDDQEEDEPKKKQKRGFKSSIHQQFLAKQEEKRQKKEEMLKIQTEKEEAMRKYQQKKLEKYKKLNKKTRKGQPVMKGRLEYLLEKIQSSIEK